MDPQPAQQSSQNPSLTQTDNKSFSWKIGFFVELAVIILLLVAVSLAGIGYNVERDRIANQTNNSTSELGSLNKELQKAKDLLQERETATQTNWPFKERLLSEYKSTGPIYIGASDAGLSSEPDRDFNYAIVNIFMINTSDKPVPISLADFVVTNKAGNPQELVSDLDVFSGGILERFNVHRFPLPSENWYIQSKTQMEGAILLKIKPGERDFNLKYTPRIEGINPIIIPILYLELPVAG